MAEADKRGNNRYTQAGSSEEKFNEKNYDRMVLKILQKEFPDDPYYSRGLLSAKESSVKEFIRPFSTLPKNKTTKDLTLTVRNNKNIIQANTDEEFFTEYELTKNYPTIDEEALDDFLDEEWEYFEDPKMSEAEPIVTEIEPAPSGLFLVNQETDLNDFHDLYIRRGPQVLSPDEDDVSNIFCVFFIQNGTAYPIPNYKTLEVMLVERGKTYQIIDEATPDQIKDFDLLLDGQVDPDDVAAYDEDDDGEVTAYEEFITRAYMDRSADWNYDIRYRSGYRPKSPFVRDPGDYIKPENRRDTEEDGPFQEEDPTDKYWDAAYQQQSWRERLREKFEGKMIIYDWPDPDNYDSDQVNQGTEESFDDSVFNVRMMVNGHWKQITTTRVFRLYAYLNGYDISDYRPGAGRYGTRGLLNLLVKNGGITRISSARDSFEGENKWEPLWTAFPHIAEADRLDYAEYQEYLNSWSNGGDAFNIDMLRPYEPAGSVKYYPTRRYEELIQQAIEQEQIDEVKEMIKELWPTISSDLVNLKISFDSIGEDISDYVETRLGRKGPLYKIMRSNNETWKYIKRKKKWFRRGYRIRTIQSRNNIFKCASKSLKIKWSLNESEENAIVNKFKWMKSVKRDKFASWLKVPVARRNLGVMSGFLGASGMIGALANGGSTAIARVAALSRFSGVSAANLAGPVSAVIFNPITVGVGALVGGFLLVDRLFGEVAADKYIFPPWKHMDDDWYLRACIYNEIDDQVKEYSTAAAICDVFTPQLKETINTLVADLEEMDDRIEDGDSVSDFQEIYDDLVNMREMIDSLYADGGWMRQVVTLQSDVDSYLAEQLKRQYRAVQYLRKKIWDFGRRNKYGIVWPKGPQKILNTYVPGLTFGNYVPKA